jgi:hypothetical protein
MGDDDIGSVETFGGNGGGDPCEAAAAVAFRHLVYVADEDECDRNPALGGRRPVLAQHQTGKEAKNRPDASHARLPHIAAADHSAMWAGDAMELRAGVVMVTPALS